MMLFLPDLPWLESVQPMAVRALDSVGGDFDNGVVSHPSGRPWVLGDVGKLRSFTSNNGSGKLVLDFPCQKTDDQIQALLEHAARTGDARSLLNELGGDGLLGLSLQGEMLLAGAVSGHRRIFKSHTDHGAVLSDSAMLLASLTRAKIALEHLVLRLCTSVPHYPFKLVPLWRGIEHVGPHNAVRVRQDGEIREERWWRAPEATLSMEHGAEGLRQALIETLRLATRDAESVSSDLSGGLDSTSIAYALTSLGVPPATYHARSVNHRNSDAQWAQRAAEHLGLELREMAQFGAGARAFRVEAAEVAAPRSDFPAVWWGSHGFLAALSAEFASLPNNVHFTGIGGDELFGPLPATTWSVLRERGLRGVPTVRKAAASARMSFGSAIRNATDRRSFKDALLSVDEHFHTATEDAVPPLGAWFPAPSLGRFLSQDGKELAISGLKSVITQTRDPLDEDRGRHQMLESLLFQGEVITQINEAFSSTTQWQSPYLSRIVIEAASSTRMAVRLQGGVVKPLLAAAMGELSMPQEFFTRPVTGEYSADTYSEFSARRTQLLHDVDHSQLNAAGLVDIKYIASRISEPSPSPEFLSELESFAALERWLQNSNAHGVGI